MLLVTAFCSKRGWKTWSLTLGLLLVTAASAQAATYQEAPELAAKVEAGELPPVAQRLPDEPKVIEPYFDIGRYGGTIRSWVSDLQSNNLHNEALREELITPKRGLEVEFGAWEPSLATAWDFSDDYRSVTLSLRRGVRWSDGDPFDAEDLLFVVNDMWYSDAVDYDPPPWALFEDDARIEAEALDAHTVVLRFPVPLPLFLEYQAEYFWETYVPSHFIRRSHPAYNREASQANFEAAVDRVAVGRPTVGPFMVTRRGSSDLVTVRNPYYWKVDTEGNQLPYADRYTMRLLTPETAALQTVAGQVDFKMSGYAFSDYPVVKENEVRGDYHASLVPSSRGLNDVLELNYDAPNKQLAAMFRERDFRRALSFAIDRSDLIETLYLGQIEPKFLPTLPDSLAWNEQFNTMHLAHDPAQAGTLLDGLGLSDRNGDGWRDYPNGERVAMKIETYAELESWGRAAELVAGYFQAIGLFAEPDVRPAQLLLQDLGAGRLDTLLLWSTWYPDPFAATRWFDPAVRPPAFNQTTGVYQWFETGGTEGREPNAVEARLHELAVEGPQATDPKRRQALAQELSRLWAESLYTIGLTGQGVTPLVVHNRLGNVPADTMAFYEDPGQYMAQHFWRIEQWYLKE